MGVDIVAWDVNQTLKHFDERLEGKGLLPPTVKEKEGEKGNDENNNLGLYDTDIDTDFLDWL